MTPPPPDRLTAGQVRAAVALLRVDGRQLAEALHRNPETLWKLMRGETKHATASRRLSADITAFCAARGITFERDGETVTIHAPASEPGT